MVKVKSFVLCIATHHHTIKLERFKINMYQCGSSADCHQFIYM